MSKEDILLRSTNNPPLVNKGAKLSNAEIDANFIDVYDALVALSQSSHVPAYSAAITYITGEYVQHVNQLYKMIASTPQVNITPGTVPALLVWLPVYSADMAQAPNGVTNFSKLITSAEILGSGIVGGVPVELLGARGVDLVTIFETLAATVVFDEGSPGGVAYGTTPDLAVYNAGVDVAGGELPNFRFEDILLSSVVKTAIATRPAIVPGAARDDNPANQAIMIAAAGGDPTLGDSDILITGTYRIIDLS